MPYSQGSSMSGIRSGRAALRPPRTSTSPRSPLAGAITSAVAETAQTQGCEESAGRGATRRATRRRHPDRDEARGSTANGDQRRNESERHDGGKHGAPGTHDKRSARRAGRGRWTRPTNWSLADCSASIRSGEHLIEHGEAVGHHQRANAPWAGRAINKAAVLSADGAQGRRAAEADQSQRKDPRPRDSGRPGSRQQNECAQRQQVGVRYPLQSRETQLEMASDRRERDTRHGALEEDRPERSTAAVSVQRPGDDRSANRPNSMRT